MKLLKEYRLNKATTAVQTLHIVKGAKIVNLVDFGFDIALIALCDLIDASTDLRSFKVCNTSETIYYDNVDYIGNFGEQHVIELL